MTFDVREQVYLGSNYSWQLHFELFSVCRKCFKPTIFHVSLNQKAIKRSDDFRKEGALVKAPAALNAIFDIDSFVSLKDNISIEMPEHLPPEIARPFREGAVCFSVGCYNAAATMFRLCIDLATRSLLPASDDSSRPQPNEKTRRDLGLRLPWLFEQKLLREELRGFASCIHQDGNDGAHTGQIGKEEAEDLVDFARLLLERLFTEPTRLELAAQRRVERRGR